MLGLFIEDSATPKNSYKPFNMANLFFFEFNKTIPFQTDGE